MNTQERINDLAIAELNEVSTQYVLSLFSVELNKSVQLLSKLREELATESYNVLVDIRHESPKQHISSIAVYPRHSESREVALSHIKLGRDGEIQFLDYRGLSTVDEYIYKDELRNKAYSVI